MSMLAHDLVIRLSDSGDRLIFFVSRRGKTDDTEPEFSIEITMDELKERGDQGAERLVGESVLGFFDHLTDGKLDLPRHYRDQD